MENRNRTKYCLIFILNNIMHLIYSLKVYGQGKKVFLDL